MATPPKWATDTVERVCRGERRYRPELRWHHGGEHRFASSGHCYYGSHIVVTDTRRDPLDAKCTLYHELAHWLAGPYGNGNAHPPAFYALMYRLVAAYGGSGLSVKAAYEHAVSRQARNAKAGLKLYRRRKRGLPDPAPKPKAPRPPSLPRVPAGTRFVLFEGFRSESWHIESCRNGDVSHSVCGWTTPVKWLLDEQTRDDWPPRPHCSRCQRLQRVANRRSAENLLTEPAA